MKVVFHPEFPRDQRKFEANYGEISPALAGRFRDEIDGAIVAIKAAPSSDGILARVRKEDGFGCVAHVMISDWRLPTAD